MLLESVPKAMIGIQKYSIEKCIRHCQFNGTVDYQLMKYFVDSSARIEKSIDHLWVGYLW